MVAVVEAPDQSGTS